MGGSNPASPAAALGVVASDALERLLDARARDRLHQVVERLQAVFEDGDGAVLEGRHEHERGRVGEALQRLSELEPVDARHPHVHEHHVELVLTQHPQRLGGAARQHDVFDVRRGLE